MCISMNMALEVFVAHLHFTETRASRHAVNKQHLASRMYIYIIYKRHVALNCTNLDAAAVLRRPTCLTSYSTHVVGFLFCKVVHDCTVYTKQ